MDPHQRLVCASLLGLLSACQSTRASEANASVDAASWPQFRGPGGLAVSEASALPRLAPDGDLRWRVAVPAGHSSPCIQGSRLFVTGHDGGQEFAVVALDRHSGDELWSRRFQGEPTPDYFHVDALPAVSTPCTDGEHVYAYLEGYGVVALDMEGELVWERRMEHPGYGFGVGPSLLIAGDVLVVPRDGAPEAAILGLDLADGSERWTIDRFEHVEAHSSPFLWRNAERDELVIAGTCKLASYDPLTAELLWSFEGTTVFPCTTPTADADTLYYAAWSTSNSSGRSFWEAGFGRSLDLSDEEIADPRLLFARLDRDGDGSLRGDEIPESRAKDAFGFLDRDGDGTWSEEELLAPPPTAPGQNLMIAVARGGEGDVSESHVRWSATRGLPYVSSPLLHQGRVWLVKAGGIVSCLDAESGEPEFRSARLDDRSEYYMSPVGVGDQILIGSAEGSLFVLDATADALSVVHAAEFGEPLFATPAVLEDATYLRTSEAVWCFAAE